MKKFTKFSFMLLLFTMAVTLATAQPPFVTLKGHVVSLESGAPMAGHTMYIALDSIFSAYYKEAVTDVNGIYTMLIPFISATTQGVIKVFTYDCNGMMVTAIGTINPGMPEVTIDFSICSNPPTGCVAAFKYLMASNSALAINFLDASYGTPDSTNINFYWKFGDNTYSTTQNPVHTYTKPGLYNVCLLINSNDSLCHSSICIPVDVGSTIPGPCQNTFRYYNDSMRSVYVFEGSLMNGQASLWTWDFGDGTTAEGQKVSHTFTNASTPHTVCLTTTGAGTNGTNCTSTSCQDVYSYNPSQCESSFSYQQDSSGTAIIFQGWAKNNTVNSWKWDFGDGTTATGQTVTHSFTRSGTDHQVCLTTTGTGSDGASCSYSSCQDVFVYIPSPCESSFWYQSDSSGTGYVFQGWAKNNVINSWKWDFGDGTTATGQTVTHSFSSPDSNYTVCLTTTSVGPGATVCTLISCQNLQAYIPSPCESSFSYQADSSGSGFAFTGYAKSNLVSSWTWDFGDGTTATGQNVTHSFNTSTTVIPHVCLSTTGTGPDGVTCTFLSCQDVYTNNPSPCENYFKINSINGSVYSFSGGVSSGAQANYYWDFGDGTSDTGQVVTHAFGKIYAVFNVCLTTIIPIPGSTGFDECKSISCQAIYNGVDSSKCKAVFSAIPDSSKNTYRFQIQSQRNYSYVYWDFGDGNQSFELNDVHTYSYPGIYTVCLTVGDSMANCRNQSCQEIRVDMIQPVCQASFTVILADSSNSTTSGYMFFNTSAPGYTNQKWSFGDGTGSTDLNPVHSYSYPGIFTACLTVWDSLGKCQSSYCMDIYAGNINNDNTVSGVVITGNKVADHGIVWLVSPTNNYNAETQIDSAGKYHFTGIPYGKFYIYAMLTPGADEFFAYMPTYYKSSLSWQGATLITTGEPNAWFPVSLVPSMNWSQGDGLITGTVNWGGIIVKAGENPLANVEVVLYNSNGDPVAYTFTNNDGTFEFSGLPYGQYTLQAEMPGKATQLIAVNLSESSSTVNIDFIVNATEIFVLGLGDLNKAQLNAGNPYPNPAGEILNLKLNASASGTAVVDIMDVQGRIIRSESIALAGGNNLISIATGNLTQGIYLLRVKSDGYKPVQRKFIK